MDNPLKPWLKSNYTGHNVILLDSIDSTNLYTKELLNDNPGHGTVVIAKTQTSGKGQQKRYWASPPGGLYYSCILNASTDEKLTMITLACGIACQEAILELSQLSTNLKWVNDIQFNNKKLGGILLESRLRGNSASLIIGIGINVNIQIASLPPELHNYSTSILNETGVSYDVYKLAALLCNSLENYFELYQSRNFNLIKSLWIKNSTTLGKKILFTISGEQREGLIIDLDESGGLVVQEFNGKEYTLSNNVDIIYLQ